VLFFPTLSVGAQLSDHGQVVVYVGNCGRVDECDPICPGNMRIGNTHCLSELAPTNQQVPVTKTFTIDPTAAAQQKS